MGRWGIDDTTHEISGTDFCPGAVKKVNQELENWLVGLSNPRLNIQFIEVNVRDKRVVILEILMALVKPAAFAGEEYIRIGSYKKKLKDFPEKERALWRSFETTPYEMRIAIEDVTEEEVTQLLDCAAYYTLMKLPLPSNRSSMMHNMKDEEFIRKMDNGQYAITNMGALLFAKDLNRFSHLKRKAVRVIQYEGTGRTNAIREMLGNMIIHQDLTMRGAGPMMEIFDTRVEASNPRCLLVDVNRIIKDTIDSGLIKLADENAAPKLRRYIPYWA